MSVVEIEVKLDETLLDIRRILRVLKNTRLDQIHDMIQAAIGWSGTYNYMFEAVDFIWSLPDKDFGYGDLNPSSASLEDALSCADSAGVVYSYGTTGQWQFTISVRCPEVSSDGDGAPCPGLVDAIGRSPPEDIGGVPGYEVFLEDAVNLAFSDYANCEKFGCEGFDPAEVELAKHKLAVRKLAEEWGLNATIQTPQFDDRFADCTVPLFDWKL